MDVVATGSRIIDMDVIAALDLTDILLHSAPNLSSFLVRLAADLRNQLLSLPHASRLSLPYSLSLRQS